MTKLRTWEAISPEQLQAVRRAGALNGQISGRQSLAKALQLDTSVDPRANILLDLHVHTLQQAQTWQLRDDAMAGLLSIVQDAHNRSVEERLTIEHSFAHFKDAMLAHSVHRPPFSTGLFTFQQMQLIIEWMLGSYYRHYKLYQYAFTNRVTLSFTSYHPSDLVEQPPVVPPLQEAITEEQHQQQVAEANAQREAQERAAAEAAAAAAEAAKAAEIEAQYEASVPEDIKERVQAAVQKELAYLKRAMEEQFQQQQGELLAKLARLEGAK